MLMSDLTKREYFALELAKATISNTSAISLTSHQLARNAVLDADALLAELEKTASKPVADDDGWISHKPGNPIPAHKSAVKFKDGEVDCSDFSWHEDFWNHKGSPGCHIIAWRPSR